MLLLPHIAEKVAQARIEKVREAWERKREGGCQTEMTGNLGGENTAVTSRALAAHAMQVSEGYVALALRVQQEAPELFEDVRAGRVTLQEAIRRIDGETDDVREREIRSLRREVNGLFRSVDTHPDFLPRLRAFVNQFRAR